MTDNHLNRRIDDKRDTRQLQWVDQPDALHPDYQKALRTRDELEDHIARCGAQLLDMLGVGGFLVPIPGTNPVQYVAAGTLDMIGNVMQYAPGSPVSTAVGEPVTAADTFAVRFIEQRAEQYLQDHADTEPDTGALVFQYGDAGREYHSMLIELVDDIRAALAEADDAGTCNLPPAGWSCSRMPGHDGPCAARLAAPTQVSAPQAVPEVLLNAKAVYDELYKTSSCSSLEEVSDVLDAIVRLIRADAPQASAAQEVRAVPDLHNAIMNIPCKRGDHEFMNAGHRLLYKNGHRDARHAAAELAIVYESGTSTAPAAMDEVRNAVKALFWEFEKGAAPFKVDVALNQLEEDGVSFTIEPKYVRKLFETAGLIEAATASQPSLDEVTGAGKGEAK